MFLRIYGEIPMETIGKGLYIRVNVVAMAQSM